MSNVILLLQLLASLSEAAQPVIAALQAAQAEGRDVSDAEVEAALAGNVHAKAALDAIIAAKTTAAG